jgi:hypothetical protein
MKKKISFVIENKNNNIAFNNLINIIYSEIKFCNKKKDIFNSRQLSTSSNSISETFKL